MNKTVRTIIPILCLLLLCSACDTKDPHKKGIAAGKAACECYKLEGLEAVEACLEKIEQQNQEFLTDTAYLSACEQQMLECITDGITDADKPITEAPANVFAKADANDSTEKQQQP